MRFSNYLQILYMQALLDAGAKMPAKKLEHGNVIAVR